MQTEARNRVAEFIRQHKKTGNPRFKSAMIATGAVTALTLASYVIFLSVSISLTPPPKDPPLMEEILSALVIWVAIMVLVWPLWHFATKKSYAKQWEKIATEAVEEKYGILGFLPSADPHYNPGQEIGKGLRLRNRQGEEHHARFNPDTGEPFLHSIDANGERPWPGGESPSKASEEPETTA